ncbi:Bug family tripartite tricarboxylate transporter substrate binding protein [Ramlibacter sp. Leaf400]|uniref:Bug family tripartite tricarboxylate transporter substrate binding protein n=1 Tax=Ramlibacter sp. Leaf400 TaxID=1736365 RepID=UPI0006F37457|nr:tripartite tricarboxylate transporter substrate binding protein [Ramlibacter sp. Leaf400]KQT10925.1 ABC transporter substrate-binding protein [Ramlibacter sp. Leaf400]
MTQTLTRRAFTCLLAATGALGAVPALADYPDKPIRMLVPFGAGGITDVVARAFADQLGRELKQSVIVDNRPGAGGNIAAEQLKRSAPDGYTLMLTTMGLVAVNPHTYSSLRFDPLADFTYISTVADTPHAIVVGGSVPAGSLGDLVTLARQKPQALSYGTAGYGSSPYQGLKLMESSTGASFLHVPFKSGSESVTNIMSGQVSMTLEALPVVLPHTASGKLKVLAIAAPKRHASAPDLKTTAELGYPGIRSSSVSGLIAPAGLPAEQVAKLNAAARKALNSTELKAKLFVQGSDATGSTPEQFVKQVQAEHAKWGKLLAGSPRI